jgi:hypothetical protein
MATFPYSRLSPLARKNKISCNVEWAKKNSIKAKKYRDKYRSDLKLEVLSHYSNNTICCAFCGYSDIRALSIDHVEGNGCEHRRKDKSAYAIYNWLKQNNFPSGFQVLCMNCQFIKRHNHKEWKRKRIENSSLNQFLIFETKQSKEVPVK